MDEDFVEVAGGLQLASLVVIRFEGAIQQKSSLPVGSWSIPIHCVDEDFVEVAGGFEPP